MSYGWDCDDGSMFKLVKSQAGKFLWKRFAKSPKLAGPTTVVGLGDMALAPGVL
ncbi:UNVERIFIED_CONTAM: hypothetical protein Sindi_2483500, partial [Sesamum indicum]